MFVQFQQEDQDHFLASSLPAIESPLAVESEGLYKSQSLPHLDQRSSSSVSPTSEEILFQFLLKKSCSPVSVKATYTKAELEATAEDLLQHLAFLSQTG